MKVKSWPKLLISILISQSAGFVGTFFTINAIPTWYAFLNKPSFSPPNWLFGPVWTILYTLIGISLYKIWIKKGDLKLFFFHLVLNAIWSPIFFGLKNLGLAFLIILMMDISLIIITKRLLKTNRISAYLLIPYLLWISFASMLNFSIWKLNPQNSVKNVFAQDFNFSKAREDYIFSEDNYKKDLFDFNLKRAAYQQNKTLSLKEELRIALANFLKSRDELIKNYLTMIRVKMSESQGIDKSAKESIYSKIDSEVNLYISQKNAYSNSENVENMLAKSKDEDTRYNNETLPVIYLSLSQISLGEVRTTKNDHIKIFSSLKNESEQLIKLGRADSGIFDRWFKDINQELSTVSNIESLTQTQIDKILGNDEYERSSAYNKANEELSPSKTSLLKLNGFVKELENIISNKR